MPGKVLNTVLLLALPASGKSEARKYLEHLGPKKCADDFHMGENIQLDDFPYVHLMRRIDEELEKLNQERIFFDSPDKPFKDPREWGTLIALLNEDYENLVRTRMFRPPSPAHYLFDRLDKATLSVGGEARITFLDDRIRMAIAGALESECQKLLEERQNLRTDSLEGKTVVIEFARGGPYGSNMPLQGHYGYQYSLSKLSPTILENATVLYIWVTPEESRRKNENRTDPNDPGSILHHGVPLDVMLNDYGCDDIDWLESASKKPGTIKVEAHDTTYYLPVARFDNRVDKTTFLRDDPDKWNDAQVQTIHGELKTAFDKLAGLR